MLLLRVEVAREERVEEIIVWCDEKKMALCQEGGQPLVRRPFTRGDF
jgi:hypothetical protein